MMSVKYRALYRTILEYSITCLVTLLAFAIVSKVFRTDLTIPFQYQNDALFIANWVKTILETGWYFNSPYLGAPGTSDLAYLPHTEVLYGALINLLGLVTKEVGLVMNIVYILSYPLAACTALFAFKHLGLSFSFAFAASLLYALQSYHFMRGEDHLLLSCYYSVPLGIWFAFWLSEKPLKFYSANPLQGDFCRLNYPWFIFILMCLFLGGIVIYYAFFTCFFIVVLSLMSGYEKRDWYPIKNASLAILFISISLAVNIWPIPEHYLKFGVMIETAQRVFYEAENYGLKIIRLLLPSEMHRFQFVRGWAQNYSANFPHTYTGDLWHYFGIYGVMGFLILISGLFFIKAQVTKLFFISRLNLAGVLLAAIGGFAIIFAYVVSPLIRCYGRISIFLVFFSLFAFFYCVQEFVKKYPTLGEPKAKWLIIAFLTLSGIYEQTSTFFRLDQTDIQTQFKSDKQFIASIESKLRAGSMVFQLPYDCFPECLPPGTMPVYDHLKLALHSKHLHWSFGAMQSSTVDRLQCSLSKKSTSDLIKELCAFDFSGITVNRRGYKDQGVELEKDLMKILKVKPILSQDGNYSFYGLDAYKKQLAANSAKDSTNKSWSEYKNSHKLLHLLQDEWQGAYPPERYGKDYWRWCQRKATLVIINKDEKVLRAKIKFTAGTLYADKANLIIRSKDFRDKILINNMGTAYSKEVLLQPGKNVIRFDTDAGRFEPSINNRALHFRLLNYEVMPVADSRTIETF